jgi:benzoylsuccinyl-CoA thiolase BbsB subunit
MTHVNIVGIGMVKFGRYPDKPVTTLGAEAVLNALVDSPESRGRIEAMFAGTCWGGSMIGQRVARDVGLPEIPIVNCENACSSGSTALHLACKFVRAGIYKVVLVLGLDKLSSSSGTLTRHPDDFEGSYGQVAPSLYAMRAMRYMHEFGATPADLALVNVKNRRNAVLNEHAMFRNATSVEEVLSSKMISDPLTMLQCCARSDGAAAVIVAAAGVSAGLHAKPVRVLASTLCSGRYTPGFRDMTRPDITLRGAEMAYSEARLTPKDINIAEVHDAFSIAEILYYETLGFSQHGTGFRGLRDGEFDRDGRIPVNVSGGLMAKGHPPGATGTAQVVEIVTQLRGDAEARQVRASVGMTHCTGGGVAGLDHGACTIHVLAA